MTETEEVSQLSVHELNSIAKALLRVARMLMENGAETRRVFETVKEMSHNMGVEEMHVLVTHRSVLVTVASGEEAVTRIVRVGTLAVNHSTVSAISSVFQRIKTGRLSVAKVDSLLKGIAATPTQYPRWLVLIMAGLACGGFSQLSVGDWRAFWACSIAASLGLWIRQNLHQMHFQPMLCVFSAAFTSASFAAILGRAFGSDTVSIAVAASVLYLVPGVPMINSVADLVKGHLLTGLARAATVALTACFASLGLVLAMKLVG